VSQFRRGTVFRHGTIALVYDFDGTLIPGSMQDYSIIPHLGLTPDRFWGEVEHETARTNGEGLLTYMRLLRDYMAAHPKPIGRSDLAKLGRKIPLFEGVSGWFERMNRYVRAQAPSGVTVKHYLISAGLKEILDGVSITKHFSRVYASEYHYNRHGIADFPKVLINDTGKTQFLFRINKGIERISEGINAHMPEEKRAIPFDNILYIGDGLTDVPSMTVTKKNGGYAIAVHKPKNRRSEKTCMDLLSAGRVDYFAPADYRAGTELDSCVKRVLDLMIARIKHEQAVARGKRR
jgi:hypothetical protein